MAKNDFQYGGWNYYNLHCGTIMTLISSGDCTLQCGMWLWNHDSEFTKWQHPAKWYVALRWRAVEITWWHHPAMWCVALGSWHWTPGGSTLQCSRWLWDWIRPNVRRTGILLDLVLILTISPQSTCHSAPVCEIVSKPDHPQQKKWRHVDFQNGGSQPSCTLGVQ